MKQKRVRAVSLICLAVAATLCMGMSCQRKQVIYVIGGLTFGTHLGDVLFGRIEADGDITEWHKGPGLPQNLSSASVCGWNGYLYWPEFWVWNVKTPS